jgi:hypothetical protein
MKKTIGQIFAIVSDMASTKGSLRGVTLGKILPFSNSQNIQVDMAILFAEVQVGDDYKTYYYAYQSLQDLVVEVDCKNGLHCHDTGISSKYAIS